MSHTSSRRQVNASRNISVIVETIFCGFEHREQLSPVIKAETMTEFESFSFLTCQREGDPEFLSLF